MHYYMPMVGFPLMVNMPSLDANLGPTVLVTGQLGSEIIELVGEISSLFGVLNEDVIELQ